MRLRCAGLPVGACRVMLLALTLAVGQAVAATPKPNATPTTAQWLCEVVYSPARQVWPRTVQLTYDAHRLLAVAIDGVPVYSFAVEGPLILTSQDNERVQLDAAERSWRSVFRGLAQGQGRCEASGD